MENHQTATACASWGPILYEKNPGQKDESGRIPTAFNRDRMLSLRVSSIFHLWPVSMVYLYLTSRFQVHVYCLILFIDIGFLLIF